MLRKLYSVRDSKGEIYNPPWVGHTHADAMRTFGKLANDPKSAIADNPEDYDLFHCGSFDDATGKIEVLDTPIHLSKAIDLAKPASSGLKSVP